MMVEKILREPRSPYMMKTKQSTQKCFMCRSRIGVYRHHIDPDNRKKTRTLYLCEPCHDLVELQPELLTPRSQELAKVRRQETDDDGEHFIHRDGMVFWIGTKTNGVMCYQKELMTWAQYETMFGHGKGR